MGATPAKSSAALECRPDTTTKSYSHDSRHGARSTNATDVRYETSGEDVMPGMSSTSILTASRDVQI